MEKKRIYIVQIGYGNRFATYDKDQAIKLLTDFEGMKRLMSQHDLWSDDEKLCWLEDLRVELISVLLDVYPSKEEAERCRENYEKAKKMGLISEKKKKV